MSYTEHAKELSKCKVHLMTMPDTAFYSTLVFSLPTRWNPQIRTAATNGKWIMWNPDFFMSLSFKERVFVLVHEAMHVAYMHMLRIGERDHNRWNRACDYVINLQLVQRGFTMPSIGLLDYRFAGLSAEEVYNILDDEDDNDECPWDDLEVGDPDDADTPAPEDIEREIDDILIRANIRSKQAGDKPGTIPGDIEIYIDRLLNPKLPWRTIARKWIGQFNRADYSFRRPNRRFLPKHYMPSLWSETAGEVAIFLDTSCSTSDDQFAHAISEVHSMIKLIRPTKVTLVQFDTEIKSVDVIHSEANLAKVTFIGRGGTDIGPVIDWITENRPQFAVIFTDGEFAFNREDPGIPITWLIYDNPYWEAEYGKVIHFETDG